MRRKHMSARKHGRKFGKARSKTRAINAGYAPMRGGFRL